MTLEFNSTEWKSHENIFSYENSFILQRVETQKNKEIYMLRLWFLNSTAYARFLDDQTRET